MRILGVGNALVDVVNRVADFPNEDSEVRALGRRRSLGGNCANSLVSLSLLGYQCSWAGSLSDDPESKWIQQAFSGYQINTELAPVLPGYQAPMSCVTLNAFNGSRTIVHFRELPELAESALQDLNPDEFDWIHFEGRNIPVLHALFETFQARGFKRFSLEVEKARDGIEELFRFPALLLFSRHYVREHHEGSIRDFFTHLRESTVTCPVFCGWGSAGAWAMDARGQIYQQPAWKPEKVIDTLGAGDAFNAGVIHGTLLGMTVPQSLEIACHLAGFKCGHEGFDAIAQFQEQGTDD
jgi:ketohexokinase